MPCSRACCLLLGLLRLPSAGGSSSGKYMNCGDSVPLCGLLTIQTGLGSDEYKHPDPQVHGLWPETGSYGSSRCIAPSGSRSDPTKVFACYEHRDDADSHQLSFEAHEWDKHGACAGVRDAQDFFAQLCSLASAPTAVLNKSRSNGATLSQMVDALKSAGYPYWASDTVNAQIELTACAGDDGRWKLAPISNFSSVCKGTPGPAPGPSPTPSPPSPPTPGKCVQGKHGPSCKSNADCGGLPGCVRCAHSGFCTDVPAGNLRATLPITV